MSNKTDLGQLLDDILLPDLFNRLDSFFPEFGWKRKGNGWVATTRNPNIPDARPDRVVCNQKGGFYVHGDGVTPWVQYISKTPSMPRGMDFVQAVKALADMLGVDAGIGENLKAMKAKTSAFEAFWKICRDAAGKSDTLKSYLESRGLPPDVEVGLCPEKGELKFRMENAGISADDIAAAGIATDTRAQGRMVIPWHDTHGTIKTFTYRDMTGKSDIRYLNHKGGEKPPFYGLEGLNRNTREVVVVEGVLDVLQFRKLGKFNVIALGGAGDLFTLARAEAIKAAAPKCRSVVLAMDADEKGQQGLKKAVMNCRGALPFTVKVMDGTAFVGMKDPDEVLRYGGWEAWEAAMEALSPCAEWMAKQCLADITPRSDDATKREALMELLHYDAGLSGALSRLEHSRIDALIAEKTGYDAADIAAIRKDYRIMATLGDSEQRAKEAFEKAGAMAGEHGYLFAMESAIETITNISRGERLERPPAIMDVDALIQATREIPEGIQTGWGTIDKADVAFMPGELSVIAARTGHGKTTMLINLLWQWLCRSTPDDLFLLYSSEEPETRIFQRLLSLATHTGTGEGDGWFSPWGVNECRDFIRVGIKARDSWPGPESAFNAAIARLKALESRLMVVYRPSWTADDISKHVHEVMERQPVTAALVDYLQRLPPPEGKWQRRDQEIAASGRILKHLAVDTDAAMVVAAQINRESVPAGYAKDLMDFQRFDDAIAKIKTSRPELHHLREGGSEQEADLVLGVLNYRADFRHDAALSSPVPETTPLDIGILKNRYGATGSWLTMAINNRLGHIREAEWDEQQRWTGNSTPTTCKGEEITKKSRKGK